MVDNTGNGSLAARLRRIGPAIVVAAVVLGPGSIVGASRVGCQYGYTLLWLVPAAAILMTAMTAAGMYVGLLASQPPCQAVATRFGRPAAWLVGASLLIAVTLFQASNNNALLMALEGLVGQSLGGAAGRIGLLVAVNAAVVALLAFGRRDLYRWVERTMAVLVGVMIIAFAANLVAARPDPAAAAAGLIPRLAASSGDGGIVALMAAGALVVTTFSMGGAFYQAYQVREKGWTHTDLRLGLTDAIVGISSLGLITMMILITAAAALHDRIPPEELTDASAVAMALEPLFGSWARIVFASGVMAGAVSSFVVNALIGGVVFSDAIGTGAALRLPGPRWCTIGALILGWIVAALASVTPIDLVSFIIIAQALTVLSSPLLAAVILWQLHKLPRGQVPWVVTLLAWAGLATVLALSARTVWGLAERFEWV